MIGQPSELEFESKQSSWMDDFCIATIRESSSCRRGPPSGRIGSSGGGGIRRA